MHCLALRITPEGYCAVEAHTATAAHRALWGGETASSTSKARALQISGPQLFGLTHPRVIALIQGLPDATRCENFSSWLSGTKPPVPELSETEGMVRLAMSSMLQALPEGVVGVGGRNIGVAAGAVAGGGGAWLSACDCDVCGEVSSRSSRLYIIRVKDF